MCHRNVKFSFQSILFTVQVGMALLNIHFEILEARGTFFIILSTLFQSAILDWFLWPHSTKSRNIQFNNCSIFLYSMIYFTEYVEDWHKCVNLENIHNFTLPNMEISDGFSRYYLCWCNSHIKDVSTFDYTHHHFVF